LSRQQGQILTWLRTVPGLIKSADPRPVTLGLKLMNAVFEDSFQLAMLRAAIDESDPPPDFLVYRQPALRPAEGVRGQGGRGPTAGRT